MLMKTSELAQVTHDAYENKPVNLEVRSPEFSVGLAVSLPTGKTTADGAHVTTLFTLKF
jgi:hypothetical protein